MKKVFTILLAVVMIISMQASASTVFADKKNEFRREISTEAPAWIVHIDTWTTPDPQAIIDLIPEDIRPYVIFNLSFSVNGYNAEEGWGIVEYAYETAKSWLTVCAENGVCATVQGASGSPCHFPDLKEMSEYEDTLYREFFELFPNFIGFNYSEQFWGWSEWTSVEDRYNHLANLLEITNEYGGYLFVSWCSNKWVNDQNPNALIELYPKWAEAVDKYSDNYVLFTKYTSKQYIEDMESQVLGNWLAEYCGNWGVRYDETGWTGEKDFIDDYTMSTGLPVMFEAMILNGATVFDGPELVFEDDFKESAETTDEDGWKKRNWESLTVFKNVMQDLFRRVMDGTLSIPTREQVLERTKLYILDDITAGDKDQKHSTPVDMSVGLYRMEGDGGLTDNHNFYKASGRYGTIPMIYRVTDAIEESGAVVVKKSEYSKRWKSVDAKVNEFNSLYPEMYTGDLFAANSGNKCVTYNPYKTEKQIATSTIPLLYNSCESMELTYSRYGSAIITEYADRLEVYLNNYDDNNTFSTRTNTFKISGCTSEPTVTLTDMGVSQKKSEYKVEYSGGVFTLTVDSNGPVEITINCSGDAKKATVATEDKAQAAPAAPPVYNGFLQHEAEHFEYKDVLVTKNGARGKVDNYTGQGYVDVSAKGSLKDTFVVNESGEYSLNVKYSAEKSPSDIVVYVNGFKISTLELSSTGDVSKWKTASCNVKLRERTNTVELRAKSKSSKELYIDNVIISDVLGDGTASPSTILDSNLFLYIGIGAVAAIAVVAIIAISKKKKTK